MATINGSSGNDTLNGTSGDDSIDAGAGADSVTGGAGNDTILGGAGNDTIASGSGAAPTYIDVANGNNVFGTPGQNHYRWLAETASNATIDLDGGSGGDNVGDGVADYILVGSTNATNVLHLRSFDYGTDKIILPDSYKIIRSSLSTVGKAAYQATVTVQYPNGNSQTFNIQMNATGSVSTAELFTTDPGVASAPDNDSLLGGDGADTFVIEDNPGNDTIVGGEGWIDSDLINMSGVTKPAIVTYKGDEAGTIVSGGDTITFSEVETIWLTAGNDSVDGTDSSTGMYLRGLSGDDKLVGGSGNDTIDGGHDNDGIYGGQGNDNLVGDYGDDTVEGGVGNDTLQGSFGHDSLIGGDGNDYVYGGFDDDTVYGNDGDDTLGGGRNNDFVDGGGGSDYIFYETSLGNDTILGGETGTDEDTLSGAWYMSKPVTITYSGDETGTLVDGVNILNFAGIEHQHLGSGDDSVDASLDRSGSGFHGGAGADTIHAGSGDDTLDGGTGDDSLSGGDGSDTFLVTDGFGSDIVIGGEGGTDFDTLDLSALTGAVTVTYTGDEAGTITDGSSKIIFSEIERLILTDRADFVDGRLDVGGIDIEAGAGNDTIIGGDVVGGKSGDTIDGGSGDDLIFAGEGNDSIEGGFGNDTVFGGAGDDFIDDVVGGDKGSGDDYFDGGDGSDTIFGGTGNDTLVGGAGADSIEGQAGSDVADYSGSDAGVTIDLTTSGNATGVGGHAQGDTLRGIDDLIGSGFDDSLSGYDQTYDERAVSNIIDGGAGNDTISGEGGNDSLIGGKGDDSIDGGKGDDTLTGDGGNDTLDGGDGADTLTGGAGADVFIADGTADTITDFDATTGIGNGDKTDNDLVDLSAYYNQTNLDAWNLANPSQTYSNPLGWLRADQANGTLAEAGNLAIQNGVTNVAPSALTAENTCVVCFAKGTRILTPRGEIPIQHLRPGDLVVTRDNGVQAIVWVGSRGLSEQDLLRNPKLKPIWIAPDITGGDAPLIVSPQHGLLLRIDGAGETLVRATHLARLRGGKARAMQGCPGVTYFHLMFEAHQILFANGAPAESFYPGPNAFGALSSAARAEVLSLLPDLVPSLVHQRYGKRARSVAQFGDLPDHLVALAQTI